MQLLIDIIGWLSAAIILVAYVLVSAGSVKGDSLTYQLLNILGAAGFVANSGWNHAMPSAVLNVVWMGIGIFTLVRARQQRSR